MAMSVGPQSFSLAQFLAWEERQAPPMTTIRSSPRLLRSCDRIFVVRAAVFMRTI
jgi:hypothetical protein